MLRINSASCKVEIARVANKCDRCTCGRLNGSHAYCRINVHEQMQYHSIRDRIVMTVYMGSQGDKSDENALSYSKV